MAKKVKLGDVEFSTITSATLHFRRILYRYKLFDRVGQNDEADVRLLFDAHPNRDEKLAGQELSHFEIHPNQGGTRCFYVVRSDGSKIDFSYPTCISELARHS